MFLSHLGLLKEHRQKIRVVKHAPSPHVAANRQGTPRGMRLPPRGPEPTRAFKPCSWPWTTI